MKESEIIKKYGIHTWVAMKDSIYLKDITMWMNEGGDPEIPERDLEIAYRHIQAKPINYLERDLNE